MGRCCHKYGSDRLFVCLELIKYGLMEEMFYNIPNITQCNNLLADLY